MPPPTPSPAPSPPTPRSAQVALAAFGVLLVGLLAVRGYGPRVGARPADHHPAAVARQVDLNAADRAELMQVPGVGPGLADAILTHRRDQGRFERVEDLTRVKGVKGKTLEKLRPWLTVADGSPGDAGRPEPAVERLERKPTAAPPPAAARSGKLKPGDPPLDVNRASEAELQRLPGVGAVTARRIVEARERQPFQTPDDLRRVKGIGAKTLEAVRPFVVCR